MEVSPFEETPDSSAPATTAYSPESYTTAERPLHTRYRKRRSFPSSPVDFELPQRLEKDVENRTFSPGDGAASTFEQASLAAQPGSPPSSPPAPPDLRTPHFSLSSVKKEPEEYSNAAEEAYEEFGTLLASAMQGVMSYADLVQLYERCCRRLSEAVREDAERQHRATEEHVLRQTATLLHAEAATWSLLWHLLGKPEESLEDAHVLLLPSPSQQDACDLVSHNEVAQRCLRIVQWLEGLASLDLTQQLERKGGYVGAYSQRYGCWHQTQRIIRMGKAGALKHVDPDAPTREQGRLHAEDESFEGGLMEDVWRLIRAGRLKEARQLCRSAGQAWRAASLGGCGDEGSVPTPSAWARAGRGREAQALEMESERGRQRRLWKWACYCASEKMAEKRSGSKHEAAVYAAMCSNAQRMLPVCSDWESACWALVRAWLDAQVDRHLAALPGQTGGSLPRPQGQGEGGVAAALAATAVPHGWPHKVQEQQPADMEALVQKLHASEQVHEAVRRSCKEPHRTMQMRLMLMDVGQLLESLRSWVTPPRETSARPAGQPHMMRFGAHLVVLLRLLLPPEEQWEARERLRHTGDVIIYTYAILLLAQQREELVALYAAQLAPYLREDLYLHLLELRQNASTAVKQRILGSALSHLPLEGPGSVMAILDRVVQESRALKPGPGSGKEGWRAHARAEGLRRVRAVQWLCFPPPAHLPHAQLVQAELCARALLFSNVLLREFALGGLGRQRKPAVEPLELLAALSAPVALHAAQLEGEGSLPGSALVHSSRQEFDCWREYFACDALYRQWGEAAANEGPSVEERNRTLAAATRALTALQTAVERAGDTWLAEDPQNEEEPHERLLLVLSGVVGRGGEDGAVLQPDPPACALLASALQATVDPVLAAAHHLQVEVRVHPQDSSQVEVTLACRPLEQDGTAPAAELLAGAAALAVKGDLPPLPEGVALLPLQAEGYALQGEQRLPASSLVRALCRRCCLPELVLRCMQLRVYVAAGSGLPAGDSSEVVQRLVAPASRLPTLFTPRQLQTILRMEAEALVLAMAARERQGG